MVHAGMQRNAGKAKIRRRKGVHHGQTDFTLHDPHRGVALQLEPRGNYLDSHGLHSKNENC